MYAAPLNRYLAQFGVLLLPLGAARFCWSVFLSSFSFLVLLSLFLLVVSVVCCSVGSLVRAPSPPGRRAGVLARQCSFVRPKEPKGLPTRRTGKTPQRGGSFESQSSEKLFCLGTEIIPCKCNFLKSFPLHPKLLFLNFSIMDFFRETVQHCYLGRRMIHDFLNFVNGLATFVQIDRPTLTC